jgi:hypothetical protein
MNTTNNPLPPMFLTVPVKTANGRESWEERLNGGLTPEEISSLSADEKAFYSRLGWADRAQKIGIRVAIYYIPPVGIYVALSKLPVFGHSFLDPYYYALSIFLGVAAIVALGACFWLYSSASRLWNSAATTAHPLMGRLIAIRYTDPEFRSLVRELKQHRTQAENNTTPAVHAAYTEALEALANYAPHTYHPDLDLARIAAATHLHGNPAVKAILTTQQEKPALHDAAKTAIDRFAHTAEDAETLSIAYTSNLTH